MARVVFKPQLALPRDAVWPSGSGHYGITYNLLNSSNVVSEDITIYKAPFFSVTAFNGGGGHTFRRFHMPNDTTLNPQSGPSAHRSTQPHDTTRHDTTRRHTAL